ncbi:hypothetical protein [Teredinibacter turnerae]|uniref:hypothetical protein n=1 Tax=Teredinibacter turnerae TaxID=2426 RepID=UPI0012BBFEBC|nr:hypothetical protein [Teredinibacter turnerae]
MQPNKVVAIVGISLFTSLISSCSGTRLYGNKSCGIGKTAYVTANGVGAICLPEREVAYILCARELSLSGVTQAYTASANVAVDISGATPEASGRVANSIVQLYESEGELAAARADAIRTCLTIYHGRGG